MEIRNAGNRIMNTWLYPIEGSWVMIDTGYENSYASVLKKLQKMQMVRWQPKILQDLGSHSTTFFLNVRLRQMATGSMRLSPTCQDDNVRWIPLLAMTLYQAAATHHLIIGMRRENESTPRNGQIGRRKTAASQQQDAAASDDILQERHCRYRFNISVHQI